MLFPNKKPLDKDPKRYSEPDFGYLNRSARPEAVRVRKVLEDWFSRYPEEEKLEFLCRFQSSGDIHFTSAAYELYLHEIFLMLGYKVTVHPENPSGKLSRPDFLLVNRSGYRFFLEATLATDMGEEDRAAEARKNVVYDSLNRLDSPNFFLSMSIKYSTDKAPSAKRMRQELSRWLSKLNPDGLAAQIEEFGISSSSSYRYKHDGWEIEFTAIPKSGSKRGQPRIRPIGTIFKGVKWISTWESIRDAVSKKGSHYGDLEAPLVVAVNVGRFDLDRIEEMQALFGQERFTFSPYDLSQKPKMDRAPNGLWFGAEGIRYRRISAVMISPDVSPWKVANRNLRLYHNPWAIYPVEGTVCTLPQAVPRTTPDGIKMEWQDGTHPREILGLSEGWPEVG